MQFWSVVVLYLIREVASACESITRCPGDRNLSEDGCCPLPGGHVCGTGIQGDCDEEFGYECKNGICAGAHNLTASGIGVTVATLSWTAFLSDGYQYEYSVLYTTSLREPIQKWNSHGVGNNVNVTLRDLIPDTWYFVRVGVWVSGHYTNFTETALFQTKAEDHCFYNGRRVPVNERLVVECEESCICRPTGRFECVPVCRKHNIESPACTEDWSGGLCCDLIRHCSYENCTYLGESVQHEQTWLINCEENCTCYDGVVMCSPHCEEFSSNETCAHPVRRQSHDGCCEVWDCEENENMCTSDTSAQNTTGWIFRDECSLCPCNQRSRDCIHFDHCEDLEIPEVSDTCRKPVVINTHCCKQVVCQNDSELDDVIEVLSIVKLSISSIGIRFQFTTQVDATQVYKFVVFYTNNTTIIDYNLWRNVTFLFTEAVDFNKNYVTYSDFKKNTNMYKVDKTFVCVISNLTADEFYYIKLMFEMPSKTTSVADDQSTIIFTSDTMVLRIPGLMVKPPVKIDAVTNSNDGSVAIQVSNILSSSVVLTWNISESTKYKLSAYTIKYKTFSDTDWHYTERLIFSEHVHVLTCLFHSRWYEARLLAHPGSFLLGTIVFNTSALIESPDEQLSTKIYDIVLDSTSVTVQWDEVPEDRRSDIRNIEIIWTSGDKNSNNPNQMWKACEKVTSKQYTLDNLNPGQMYMVWIGFYMQSGKTVYSNRIHFVTSRALGSEHSTTKSSIIVAIAVSCISVVSMVIAIVTVIYMTRCRRRSAYQTHTSFENRIFQIYKQREDDPDL